MIQLSPLNPIRFIDTSDINSGFDGDFSIYQTPDFTNPKCYFQKWQTSDTLKLQCISDAVPSSIELKNEDNKVIDTLIWQASTLIIPSLPNFVIYEIEYSFAGTPIGKYFFEFQGFVSEPICVAIRHQYTKLLIYKNSVNDYSTVFDTSIEFEFRVECEIKNFKPKNDRETYNDQRQNLTQLFSVAYKQFTFIVGGKVGVQEWVLDLVNKIQQCDQVSYDGIFYQPIPDAEFEVIQPEFYDLLGGTIEIQPVDNNFSKFVTQPVQSGTTFTPVQKSTPFSNGSGNQVISNLFKNLSFLEHLLIYKTGADYVLNVGTTPNGFDIIKAAKIDKAENVLEVNFPFTGTSDVYLSGSGLNYNIMYALWKQVDEPPINLGSGQTAPPLGKNAGVFFFELQPGDLANSFNPATGLGLQNTDWSDWTIAGYNGTPSMDGKFPIGWDRLDTITIGNEVGSETITIGRENLPDEGIEMFSSNVQFNPDAIPDADDPVARSRSSSTPNLNYQMSTGAGEPNTGRTAKLGQGTALPHTPLSRICVYVIKIN